MKEATFYIGDKPAILAHQDGDWYLVNLAGAFTLAGTYTHIIELVSKLVEISPALDEMLETGKLKKATLMYMKAYGIVAMTDAVCYATYETLIQDEASYVNALLYGDVLKDLNKTV